MLTEESPLSIIHVRPVESNVSGVYAPTTPGVGRTTGVGTFTLPQVRVFLYLSLWPLGGIPGGELLRLHPPKVEVGSLEEDSGVGVGVQGLPPTSQEVLPTLPTKDQVL